MKKLIIHASNVHEGGGRTLLLPLLKKAKDRYSVTAFLDKRLSVSEDTIEGINKVFVKPTLLSRLIVEYKLYKLANKNDTVLCFGSLPPVFKLKSKVALYIQNRYLVNNKSLELG